jgi:stage IV sporulation protein FB
MFVFLFTGHIFDFLVFTLLILFHELGHILSGIFFSWNIKEVIVLPFGCLTIFDTFINTSLFEQFVVTFMGPFFQIIFYLFFSKIFILSNLVTYYNFLLLIFNLLPIYPLDGSKFVYIFLCLIFPFRFVYFFLIFISFLFLFLVFFFCSFDLIVYLILFFLLFKCVCELKKSRFIFLKFLFERYIYSFNFKSVKIVSSISKMFLNSKHLFYDGSKYITEYEKLSKMFDNDYKLW